MYLKKIELRGFKSFADYINLEFNGNITCIVGPNGSGKSNITDAFRWVLGEQKYKNLRTSAMNDVIFSGTQKRNALSYASVTITFDNSDRYLDIEYTDVSICRKIFKSGENQYFINNNLCRLKDIKNLLFDTGIGVEGYSIIAQGRVEQLLSSNKEERRNIFEEAAGIVKFKNSKEITEKNLNEANINLDKINAIYNEMNNRLEPLKKQTEIAKKYLDYSENKKKLQLNYYFNNLYNLNKEIEINNLNILDSENKIKELKLKDNELISKELEYKDIKDEIEKKIYNSNQEILNLINKKNKFEYDKKIFENEIEYLNKEINENTEKISEYNSKYEHLNNELMLKKSKEKFLKTLIIDNSIYDIKIEDIKDGELLECIDYVKKILEYDLEINNLKNDYLKEKNLKNKIFEIDKNIFSVNMNLNLEKNNYENLLNKRINDRTSAVKEILEYSKYDKNVIGIIQDLYKNNDEYDIAIETALSSYMHNIVVADVESCNKYIDILKQSNKGRVTFLPLSNIEIRNINDKFEFEGFIGHICNLIQYDKKYDKIFKYLLHNVYVVKDNVSAKIGIKLLPKNSKIITLSSDVYIVGGYITGGSLSKKNNELIQNKLKIKELKMKISKLNDKLKNYIIEKENIELELKNLNISDIDNKMEEITNNKSNLEKNISNIKQKNYYEIDYIVKNIENLKNDIFVLNSNNNITKKIIDSKSEKFTEDENYSDTILNLKKQIEQMKLESNNINIIIKNLNSEMAKNKQEIYKLTEILSENKIKLNNNLNSKNNFFEKLNDYSMNLEDLENYIESNKLNNYDEDKIKVEIKDLSKKISDLGNVNLNAIQEYEELSEKYDFINKQRDDLIDSVEKIKSTLSDIEKNMKKVFKEKLLEIDNNFRNIFSKLFNGGNASIDIDENNILDSDIDIKAQPPGKKLQYIELMSGGEKALTAIALLFSILETKPVAFCILDEIEAALDDANIYRFSQFIEEYSKKTQFIIITHRHLTMQMADSMFGVTMQEQGISKILSINLNDINIDGDYIKNN